MGIAFNLTPFYTIILSFVLTGELAKLSDVVFLLVTFIAVSLITYGNYKKRQEEMAEHKNDEVIDAGTYWIQIYLPIITMIVGPTMMSLGTVLDRML